ncbi:hypothetical protein HDU78_001557 [Chytriomyces hyalinus]|nr:hypothetical protein HDU78_001557 [Chytriomyces hyalinus]KAJ3266485.1 hypothetical protein HDU77_000585 [Chytriomyces hyalinus]
MPFSLSHSSFSNSSNATFNDTVNLTIDAVFGPPALGSPYINDAQYAVLGVILGMTIEISFTGLITTLCRALQGSVTQGEEFFVIGIIMTIFNFVCIAYQSLVAWVFFLGEEQCGYGSLVGNVFLHIFNLGFDIFMLYKTYCVAAYDLRVQYTAMAIIAHRFGWAIVDIMTSKGVWNPDLQYCAYAQDIVTFKGYASSDMISHIFACILSLVFGCLNFEGDLAGVGKSLVEGNILRSVVTVAICAYSTASGLEFNSGSYSAAVAMLVQAYVLSRCVNAELFYSVGRVSYAKPGGGGTRSIISSQGYTNSAVRSDRMEDA